MAADNELRLISKVVRSRDYTVILEKGVAKEWFADDECREVFGFISNHWSRYDEVPTANVVKDHFPTLRLLKVDDTVEYMVDQLIAYRRRKAAIRTVSDASDLITNGDHEAAIKLLTRAVTDLGDEGAAQVREYPLVEMATQTWPEYKTLRDRGTSMLGLASGFPTIDEATAGFQPGQLVTIIAEPKVGKSILAMQCGINVHDQQKTVAMQSFEMSNEEQKARHNAMRAKIAHSRLTRGTLDTSEEVRLRKTARRLSTLEHEFILMDSGAAVTVSALAAKVEILKPDLMIVDGVYLMIDEVTGESGTPQALTNITRGLKRLAQRYNIPVIISTQVLSWKKKGTSVTADSIGYSSSFYQDSDVILGLDKDENDPDVRRLSIVASRNCGPADTILQWLWDKGTFEEEPPIQSVGGTTPAQGPVTVPSGNNAPGNNGGRP